MLAERKEQQRLRSADSSLAARLVPVLTFHTRIPHGLLLMAACLANADREADQIVLSFLLRFPGSNLTTSLLSAVPQFNIASLGKSR